MSCTQQRLMQHKPPLQQQTEVAGTRTPLQAGMCPSSPVTTTLQGNDNCSDNKACCTNAYYRDHTCSSHSRHHACWLGFLHSLLWIWLSRKARRGLVYSRHCSVALAKQLFPQLTKPTGGLLHISALALSFRKTSYGNRTLLGTGASSGVTALVACCRLLLMTLPLAASRKLAFCRR